MTVRPSISAFDIVNSPYYSPHKGILPEIELRFLKSTRTWSRIQNNLRSPYSESFSPHNQRRREERLRKNRSSRSPSPRTKHSSSPPVALNLPLSLPLPTSPKKGGKSGRYSPHSLPDLDGSSPRSVRGGSSPRGSVVLESTTRRSVQNSSPRSPLSSSRRGSLWGSVRDGTPQGSPRNGSPQNTHRGGSPQNSYRAGSPQDSARTFSPGRAMGETGWLTNEDVLQRRWAVEEAFRKDEAIRSTRGVPSGVSGEWRTRDDVVQHRAEVEEAFRKESAKERKREVASMNNSMRMEEREGEEVKGEGE